MIAIVGTKLCSFPSLQPIEDYNNLCSLALESYVREVCAYIFSLPKGQDQFSLYHLSQFVKSTNFQQDGIH
jgi:hypothetical protein